MNKTDYILVSNLNIVRSARNILCDFMIDNSYGMPKKDMAKVMKILDKSRRAIHKKIKLKKMERE